MKLVLPYPPSANRNWRTFRGRTIISKESREYREFAGLTARMQHAKAIVGPCAVTIHLFRPRKAGDLDGRLKVLLDTLNGIAWQDDAQIVEIHAYRHEDPTSPRVEVEAVAVPVTDSPSRQTKEKT